MFLKLGMKAFTDLQFYLTNQGLPRTFSVMIYVEAFTIKIKNI